MLKDYTDITVVLDRSGSMQSTRTDAEGGFNSFVADQRKIAGKCLVTLTQFDDVYEVVYSGRPISDVPPLTLVPRNSTALLDAIGKTINDTGKRLAALSDADRPEHVIVVIITDGGENASREFKGDKIQEMIKHQRETYNWQFVFIGANQDAIATAASIGIPQANSLTFAANAVGTRGSYESLSNAVSHTRRTGGQTQFREEDREAQVKAGA